MSELEIQEKPNQITPDAVKDDENSRRLIFTALHETFITYLKVAFFVAIFLGSPVLLIQIYLMMYSRMIILILFGAMEFYITQKILAWRLISFLSI